MHKVKINVTFVIFIFFVFFLRIFCLDKFCLWNDEKAFLNAAIGIRDGRLLEEKWRTDETRTRDLRRDRPALNSAELHPPQWVDGKV